MNKKMLILFAAEIAAIAAMRAIQMIRRDRAIMPRAAKVKTIRNRPVISRLWKPRQEKIEDWTPRYVDGKIQHPPEPPDR